jgi:hypothetical protein
MRFSRRDFAAEQLRRFEPEPRPWFERNAVPVLVPVMSPTDFLSYYTLPLLPHLVPYNDAALAQTRAVIASWNPPEHSPQPLESESRHVR